MNIKPGQLFYFPGNSSFKESYFIVLNVDINDPEEIEGFETDAAHIEQESFSTITNYSSDHFTDDPDEQQTEAKPVWLLVNDHD